jgi:hypothetical protein
METQSPDIISELGQPIKEYGRSYTVLLSFAAYAIIGLLMLIYGLSSGSWLPSLVAIIALVGLTVGVLKFMNERNSMVKVFADGIAEIGGAQDKTIRWGNIESISISRQPDDIISIIDFFGSKLTFNIEANEGVKLSFSQAIWNHVELGRTVIQETTKRLLPKAIELFDGGKTVSFGEFSISKQGFTSGDKTIKWDNMKGIAIPEDTAFVDSLLVVNQMTFVDVPTGRIFDTTQNYDVLIRLLKYAIKNYEAPPSTG